MTFLNQQAAGQHKGCEYCGGKLIYDINKQSLVCVSCSKWAPIDTFDSLIEGEDQTMMNVVEYRCPQCGAAVHTTQTNMVSYCNFCGSTVMFSERMTSVRRPERIAPFLITREKCEKIYWQRINGSRFVPDDIKQTDLQLKFQPVYVPFYCYREAYSGQNTGTQSRTDYTDDYIITDTYKVDYEAKVEVFNELHCASSQMEAEVAEKLSFSIRNLVPFKPGYLSGFYAEAPDMDDNREYSGLTGYAKYQLSRATIFTDNASGLRVSVPRKVEDEVEVVLLPVWLLAERQQGRLVYTAINGMNGDIVCDIPIEKKKTIRYAGVLAAGLTLLFYLIFSYLIVMPKLVAASAAMIASACYYVVNHSVRINEHRQKEAATRRDRVKLNHRELITSLTTRMRDENADMNILLSVGIVAGLFLLLAIGIRFEIKLLLFAAYFLLVALLFMVFTIKTYIKSKKFQYTYKEWLLRYGAVFVLIAMVIFSFNLMSMYDDELVASIVSDKGWLAPYMLGCSLFSLWKGRLGKPDLSGRNKDNLLFWGAFVLVLLTLVLSMVVHNQFVFYALAMAIMTVLSCSFLRLLLAHNEYVTRPVPYFGKKEAEK